jgi:hypothetical protein
MQKSEIPAASITLFALNCRGYSCRIFTSRNGSHGIEEYAAERLRSRPVQICKSPSRREAGPIPKLRI